MDFETISEQLLRHGVVDTVRTANTTAMYALLWMHGQTFDFKKSQTQINLSKFSPVTVREIRQVKVSDCPIPDWYQMPQIFELAS